MTTLHSNAVSHRETLIEKKITNEEVLAEIKAKMNVYDNGITAPMLSTLIGVSVDRVRKLLRAGVAQEVFTTTIKEGKTLYYLAGREQYIGRLTPHRMVDVFAGVYDGQELKPLPGINRDRFEAYTLPSIRGAWRVWPDGTKERL